MQPLVRYFHHILKQMVMRIVFHGMVALSLLFCVTACKKGKNDTYQSFDEIPTDTYYASDVFTAAHANVNGHWVVYNTSGGFSGAGYPADFQKLLIKPNGIFGILNNNSLVAYGKIVVQSQTAQALLVEFVPQTPVNNIQLLADREKYVTVRNQDSLDLVSPCCDRFDTYLKRE